MITTLNQHPCTIIAFLVLDNCLGMFLRWAMWSLVTNLISANLNCLPSLGCTVWDNMFCLPVTPEHKIPVRVPVDQSSARVLEDLFGVCWARFAEATFTPWQRDPTHYDKIKNKTKVSLHDFRSLVWQTSREPTLNELGEHLPPLRIKVGSSSSPRKTYQCKLGFLFGKETVQKLVAHSRNVMFI